MAKRLNTTESSTLRVTLSRQAVDLLEQIASKGIYGRNPAEVAGRFVDAALERFVEAPRLRLGGKGAR